MSDVLAAALEYLDRGWSIIPVMPDTKRPAIKWVDFQHRNPTEEEVTDWFTRWPDADIGVVTGAVSGIVIVDCDNEEALAEATAAGMCSGLAVKTKRGRHLYFRHPMDGKRRGPRAGSNVREHNPDWPRVNGLDFRGDGSYAVLPPSRGYSWDIGYGLDENDPESMPIWKDWKPKVNLPDVRDQTGFDFSSLDLSDVPVVDGFGSEWERTEHFIKEQGFAGGKIPTGQGNGRNDRVLRYASELILQGYWGPELRLRAHSFMAEFFMNPLGEREFEATCASVEQMERRNHPERFDTEGNYIYVPKHKRVAVVSAEEREPAKRLIFMDDAETLLKQAESTNYLIEPWLPRGGTIVQVHGFSGHGKSLFVQWATYALATGRKYFGPFEINGPARTLYLDFENGRATVGRRLREMRSMFGDAGDRLGIWTPYVENREMNFNVSQSLVELQAYVEWYKPDVVVIDTVRTAWPGLEENSAESWAKVNTLCLRLRNAGISVIVLHHSNKPGENGLGREAGSTNQLTVLETQIRITQVFTDEHVAKTKAGVFDGSYSTPVWPQLKAKLPAGANLLMVMEARYGKVREWTDMHDDVQWIGIAADGVTDERFLVSSMSTKQRAKAMAVEGGLGVPDIADGLSRSQATIRKWLGLEDAPARVPM